MLFKDVIDIIVQNIADEGYHFIYWLLCFVLILDFSYLQNNIKLVYDSPDWDSKTKKIDIYYDIMEKIVIKGAK